jgi:predicted transcriptional regulator
MKLFDAELKLMEVLWKEGPTAASKIAEIMNELYDWKKTTTYTFIKRCIDKGAVKRSEPHFICHPVISVNQAREYETVELINKMYNGSADLLVASLLEGKILSKDEIEKLKRIVTEMSG